MNRTILVVGAAALVPALLGISPQDRGGAAPWSARVLWIFMSLAETDLRKDLEAIGHLRREVPFSIRPCLLAEDFGAMTHVKQVHVDNVKALRDLVGGGFGLQVMDEEGLALARALGLERLPAYALVDPVSRRAHVVYGRGARLSEVFRCE